MVDAKLVERAKGGDAAAYERLVRGQQEVAFRTAYLITGDASEAEDATQEAFVKAYRSLWRFPPGAPFRPWLLSIVANEAKNRSKAAGRRARLALRAATEAPVGDASSSPEAAAVAAELRAELLLALEPARPAKGVELVLPDDVGRQTIGVGPRGTLRVGEQVDLPVGVLEGLPDLQLRQPVPARRSSPGLLLAR